LGDCFLLFKVETMIDEQFVKCRPKPGDGASMREELAKQPTSARGAPLWMKTALARMAGSACDA